MSAPLPTAPTPTAITPPLAPAEHVVVQTKRLSCDGTGEGIPAGLGHPKVYFEMGGADFADCPYCGRRFVLDTNAPTGAAH